LRQLAASTGDKSLLPVIAQLVQELEHLGVTVEDIGAAGGKQSAGDLSKTGVQEITERSAFTMIDLQRTTNVILRNIEALLRGGALALSPVSLGPLTAPTTTLAAGGGAGGALVVHVTQNITVNAGLGADANAIAAATGRASRSEMERLDESLLQRMQGRRRTKGDITVT
jgi:hypothetical protein